MIKSLTPKKFQEIVTYICGGRYIEKSSKGPPPLKISKISKKSQDKEDEIEIYTYEANK